MNPWESAVGIWGSMTYTKSLVWLTYLRRWMRLSMSAAWGLISDLDNSSTGNLMSSLSCDIHKSLPIAVLNFECISFSHWIWSSFGICWILIPLVAGFPVTLKRPNRLSMSFCGIPWWFDLIFLNEFLSCSCFSGYHEVIDVSHDHEIEMTCWIPVQRSDFIWERLRFLRTWFKWTCRDLSESLRS